jgi:hypothetical protein
MRHHLSAAYFNHDRIFKLLQDGANASACLWNMMKNDDTSME